MDGDLPREILPEHPDVEITKVSLNAETVTIEATVTTPAAECPSCGHLSDRVHSRYIRRLKDQPCRGRKLLMLITARKFLCLNPKCFHKVFCERLPSLAAKRASMRFERKTSFAKP